MRHARQRDLGAARSSAAESGTAPWFTVISIAETGFFWEVAVLPLDCNPAGAERADYIFRSRLGAYSRDVRKNPSTASDV
jgi:hypothetical protein